MSNIPAFVIKDCTFLADATNRIGQCSKITIPVLEKTMEEFRNAGMIKPREVPMGFETTTCQFEETAFDPQMLKLFDMGADELMIARGYMQSEDGTEHAARFEMYAEVKKIDAGDWSPASKATTNYDVTVHRGTLYIETNGQDEEVFRFTDHEMAIGGVVQNPGRARALGTA